MVAKKIKSKKLQKRKIARTNKRLLTIVLSATAVIAIGLMGLWYFVEFRGAERNITSGDALVAEGNYRAARKQYGRAVTKEPNNLKYIQKLRDTYLHITPATPEEARSFYSNFIGTLIHVARYNPRDIDAQLDVAREMFSAAHITTQDIYWRKLQSAAEAGLDRIDLDNPRRHELILLIGLAKLHLEDASMTDTWDEMGNVRFPGEDEIELVLESDPGNPVAWAALAHGRMSIYYRLLNESRTQQAGKNKAFAVETMSKALSIAGDNFEVSETALKNRLLILTSLEQKYLANPKDVTDETLDAAMASVEEAIGHLLDTFNPIVHSSRVRGIVSLLVSAGPEGDISAIKLLEKYLEEYPKDYGSWLLLSRMYERADEIDKAKTASQIILDADQQKVSLFAVEQYQVRPQAAQMLVVFATANAALSETDEDRMKFIAEAKQNRNLLADFVSHSETNPLLIYSDGVIALVEKDFNTAALKLEEVIRRNPLAPARVYREAAISLAESGAMGFAKERLTKALELEPTNLANYILKARVELMLLDYGSAKLTLLQLPEESRLNPQVQELLDSIYIREASDQNVFSDETLGVIAKSIKAISNQDYVLAIELVSTAIDNAESPDWRLYKAMASIHLAKQDMEATKIWVEKALELNPGSEELRKVVISMESDDSIAAVITFIEQGEGSESEKAETLAVMLFDIGMYQAAEGNRWFRSGNIGAAEEALKLSDRAFDESEKYQAIAEAAGSKMNRIILVKFNQSLAVKNIQLASELLESLTEIEKDPLVLGGARVRFHLSKSIEANRIGDVAEQEKQTVEALELTKKMTLEVPFSDYAWKLHGTILSASGKYLEALAAYAEAYRIAPKDKENIRRYVGLLASTKTDPQRLLRIARLAKDQYPTDEQLNNVWLEVELELGEPWTVMSTRLKIYSLTPSDRLNALQLAHFLVNATPTRELVLELDGSELFSVRDWNQMTQNQRTAVLTNARSFWDGIVEQVMVEMRKENDPDIRTAFLHAKVARDRGQLDEASAILDKFIESRKGTEEYTKVIILAADFLQRSERHSQSVLLLRNALEFQGDRFEIDSALGTALFNIGSYEESAKSLAVVVKATGNRNIHARWIEALAMSGQFEKAEEALEQLVGVNKTYSEAMLSALISRVKSEHFLTQGDIAGGTAELVSYRNALRAAIEIDPVNSVPYIRLCRSLLNEYRLTQEKILLEEALVVADDGSRYNTKEEQFAVVRADVLQADGQLHRAIDMLNRFVTQYPNAAVVRQRLIEAYLDTDNLDKAIAVVRSGIMVNPSDSTWYRHLGDMHIRADDNRSDATQAYLDAIQRSPSMSLLKRIDEITRTDQELPNRKLLKMAQGPLSKLHPIVASIEAKALDNLGRRRDALLAMSKSWDNFVTSINNGWIPESSISLWFLDLHYLFIDDPEAGDAMVHDIIGGPLSRHQLAGLSSYWQAFGSEYIDKALDTIEKGLLNSEPGTQIRARLMMLKGGYLVEAGMYQESKAVFQQLANESDSALVLNNLAYVVGVYMNKPEEGLVLAKQAAEKAPRNASVVDTVATLYARSGQAQRSAEMLEFLLQIDPTNQSAMSKLALLYAEPLQQPDRAVVFAERARSQNPRSPEVLDALGWSYYRAGRKARGEDYLLRSIKRGENMSAYLHLAQVVMDKGKQEKALDLLRMAQELAQDEYSLNRIKVLQDDIRNSQPSVDE